MKQALRRAFPRTLPVLAGYLFLGVAYGISMKENGFGAAWSGLISLILYGGSMQFALIDLLRSAFAPLTVAALTVLIQARHLFYGLTMLEKYRAAGACRPYLIFALTDETYSLVCREVPRGIESEKWYLSVSLLDHVYWVSGSVLGGLLGSLIPVSVLNGMDFAMTALFVVILTEQILSSKEQADRRKISRLDLCFSPVLGGCATLLCLLLAGRDSFLLPAMGLILLGFLLRWFVQERGKAA